MMDYNDINDAYRKVKKDFPGQVAVFCCDLGDSWLFKLRPKEAVGDPGFINGYFGTEIDKKSGEVRQYNMLKNSAMLSEKTNLANELRNESFIRSVFLRLKYFLKR